MDETQKQRLLASFVAFNIVFILYQIFFNTSNPVMGNFIMKLFIAAILGSIAAGITYGVMAAIKK